MDHFLMEELLQGNVFWYEISPVNANPSAFLPYTSRPSSEIGVEISGNNRSCSTNINKRMIEFMRRSCPLRTQDTVVESESKRCHRHKISERLRREREKKGYLALHSMLPPGTKNDKNSIMQMAARRIQELKNYKEVLETRNNELESELAAMGGGNMGTTKIKIKVANPKSGMDSMIQVLKCLKSMGSKTRSIKSKLSNEELLAVMETETEIEAADVVEKAVQRALNEVETKLLSHFQEGRLEKNTGGLGPKH